MWDLCVTWDVQGRQRLLRQHGHEVSIPACLWGPGLMVPGSERPTCDTPYAVSGTRGGGPDGYTPGLTTADTTSRRGAELSRTPGHRPTPALSRGFEIPIKPGDCRILPYPKKLFPPLRRVPGLTQAFPSRHNVTYVRRTLPTRCNVNRLWRTLPTAEHWLKERAFTHSKAFRRRVVVPMARVGAAYVKDYYPHIVVNVYSIR